MSYIFIKYQYLKKQLIHVYPPDFIISATATLAYLIITTHATPLVDEI